LFVGSKASRLNGAGGKNKFQKELNHEKNTAPLSVFLTLILIFVGSHIVTAQTFDLSSQGSKFITFLSGGDYKSAVAMFDETTQKTLPDQKLN
jgi:hypothetical protein